MKPNLPPYQRWRGFFLLIVCISILVWGIESWRRSVPEGVRDDRTSESLSETVGAPLPNETVSGATSPKDDTLDSRIEPQAVMPPVVASNGAPVTHVSPPISDLIPDLKTLRQQVERDPHNTPPALLKFSVAINRRVTSEAGTEAGASQLFGELEDCVLNPKQKGSATVQALCLLNAHRLAQRYPTLEPRAAELSERSDPEAARRAKALY